MDNVLELVEDQVIRAAQWEYYSTAETPQRPVPVPFAEPSSWALNRIAQRKAGDNLAVVGGIAHARQGLSNYACSGCHDMT
jgi:hypothetical protein